MILEEISMIFDEIYQKLENQFREKFNEMPSLVGGASSNTGRFIALRSIECTHVRSVKYTQLYKFVHSSSFCNDDVDDYAVIIKT